MAQMLYTGMTHEQIRNQLARETGISLSLSQISYDVSKIREEWQATRVDTYEAMIEQELQRLDVMEAMLWQAIRDSTEPDTIEVIDKSMKRMVRPDTGEEELQAIVKGIKETVKSSKVNVALFSQISDVQRERRRLLGLYAPSVSVNKQEVRIKAYRTVSPDDWDDDEGDQEKDDKDVIEGEYDDGRGPAPKIPLLPLQEKA